MRRSICVSRATFHFGLTISDSQSDITPGGTISQGFPAAPTVNYAQADNPSGAQSSVDPNFRPGYAEQFNLGMEQEFAPLDMVLKIVGVGNLGRAIYNPYNINQAIPGATALNTRRPLYWHQSRIERRYVSDVEGKCNYYALQLTLDKRLSHGVNFLMGYAWAHSIDNVPLEFGGGAAGSTPQDPRFL